MSRQQGIILRHRGRRVIPKGIMSRHKGIVLRHRGIMTIPL
ncbi:hypothetical protein [Candidatus Electrothrix sp.]